ncbi:hypothetical protein EST38_g4374 [Candolleomyces aberdarensis]|uniref:Uncharacterized protein n=1 Tax=Candolleomyces aberdarensis TaxID=2316362 RepID=A0A4V1Q4B2_9AGAR|nr:hypothetical protein EST38_g4374 [Candolleomyces aberdarensis]
MTRPSTSVNQPTPRIYGSTIPPIPVNDGSVYTLLFQTNSPEKTESFYTYPTDRPAFIDAATGDSLSRGELKELTLKLGYGLRNHVVLPSLPGGTNHRVLSRGDVVMIFSPNSLSWPVMLFGAVAAGLKITLASSTSTALELSHQWIDSKARMLVVAPSHLSTAIEMFTSILKVSESEARSRIWVMDRLWDYGRAITNESIGEYNSVGGLLGFGRLESEERFDGAEADETVYICYSSGTTGKPKGVESSHRAAGSVFRMAWEIFKSIRGEHDVSLALLPFYHIFGLIAHLHHSFYLGMPTVILTGGFEPTAFCQAIERYKVTMAMVVPPILQVLIQHPAATKYDLRSLRTFISGAAPLSRALVHNVQQKFKPLGWSPIIVNGYGATETTLTVTVVPPSRWDDPSKIGAVGVLAPNLECRIVKEVAIVRDARGRRELVVDAEEGEEGEMWVRGPTRMKGYLHNAKATQESFHAEGGWYKTGDILRRDKDGYFWVVDRKKEMIKYKGLQVAPAELEALLLEHPQVQDVGVVGVMDEYSGNELPRAYVVPSDSTILEDTKSARRHKFEQDVKEWLAQRVSRHKQLRGGVVTISAIPKSPTGKILRRELRSLVTVGAVAASSSGHVTLKAKL